VTKEVTMSEQKPPEESAAERSDEEMKDLDVPAEEAEDVKGGQEMPPFPRQIR